MHVLRTEQYIKNTKNAEDASMIKLNSGQESSYPSPIFTGDQKTDFAQFPQILPF